MRQEEKVGAERGGVGAETETEMGRAGFVFFKRQMMTSK